MIRTPICDLLGIQYPIFQGGMAWIADADLAAALSNGGGLGVIAARKAPAAPHPCIATFLAISFCEPRSCHSPLSS